MATNQKGIDYMSKYIKRTPNCKCCICGKLTYKRPNEIKRSKSGLFTCSMECYSTKQSNDKYKEMCVRVGEDFKEFLFRKYHSEMQNSREIALGVYGRRNMGPNIIGWMERLGIEVRSGSESVKLQWVDNDERRDWQSNFAKENLSGGTPAREELIKVMQTKEYKEKSASAKLGRNNPMYGVTGDKHPQWNPELSDGERITKRNYPEYTAWRTSVFERDGYTCQVCLDKVGGNLTAHHINGYHWDKGGRTDINNGITLCDSCHKEFHSIYGYKDVNLFQFSQFLEYKQQALNN